MSAQSSAHGGVVPWHTAATVVHQRSPSCSAWKSTPRQRRNHRRRRGRTTLRWLAEAPQPGSASLAINLRSMPHAILVVAFCRAVQPPGAREHGDAVIFGGPADEDPDELLVVDVPPDGSLN
jgi:hypothetical protein